MTKIGPRDPTLLPLPAGPTAPAGVSPTAPTPAEPPPLNPRRLSAEQRPPVIAPTQGDKRTRLALTSLTLSGQQLLAEKAPLESIAIALNRVRGQFKPYSAEQVMCDLLLDAVDDAAHESPPSALQWVVARFPDLQSQAHGAFKAIARAIDCAAQRRVAESHTVEQVILGFVPGLGVAIDLEDLLSAIDKLEDGKDGAGYEVAIASAAFLPGLDFLKAGKTAAGRQALRAAAEDLPEISRQGLRILADKLGPEAAELAQRQVRVFNVARSELIARIDAAMHAVPQNLAGLMENLRGALTKHAQPNDIVGALRDVAGVPVAKNATEFFDHEREVETVLQSLRSVLQSADLKTVDARHFLEGALHDCRKLLEGIVK